MPNKQLFVNAIVEDGRFRLGVVGLDKTALENIRIIYGEDLAKKILFALTQSHPQGGYLIDRFCQFIIFIQFQPGLGFSMKVSDFNGDINLALDEYIVMRQNGWLQEDRDKIMRLFQQIGEVPLELAEIIIQDPIPLS